MNHELIALDDERAADPTLVGAKAAGLARLVAAGFAVPDAVILPAGLRDRWPTGPAPEPIRAAVDDACTALGPRLAVRSSSTWEDGQTSAHAGATATVLDVSGPDAVLDAIRHCLDADDVAARAEGTNGDVAIVLQRLVDADHAGVAFTADPLTGERGVVRLAATPGLGEALVQGEVVGSDVTVRGDAVDGDLAGLPADHARAVAAVARDIEAALGRPQDIEWAVLDGDVHLLQARPITILPVEPALPTGNNWQKDTAHYPEPLTPFGWAAIEVSAPAIRSVFDEMGLLVRGLEERFVGGEIYGRVLPAFGSADSASKPPPAFVLGLAARVVPELRRRNVAARRAIESGSAQRWAAEWHATDRDEMARRADALGAVDLAALDDRALIAHLDACVALAQRGIQIHFRLVMPLFQALHRLHTLVGDELGWDDATIAGMFAGHSPATRAAEEAMVSLRHDIRRTPGAADALAADLGHPEAALRAVDPALADRLSAWADEHGWAMVNYDAGVPVLAERPAMLSRLVLSEHTPTGPSDADTRADEARAALAPERRAAFDEALADARSMYGVREDNTAVVGDRPLALLRRWMLEVAGRLVARGAIPTAADAAYLTIDELRDALAGDDGDVIDRIVERRGEEAWVRAHPGPAYLGEQAAPPDIAHLPTALRQVNEPVLWAISHEYPTPVEVPDGDEAVLLAGVAAAAGVAEGPVRVIASYRDMDRLEPGEVLVCQVTSPSWAPLFPLAAAVVADGGGVLSHAAIAAREHGLPAVLGTGTATTSLHDGQTVRVDGTRGLVLAIG